MAERDDTITEIFVGAAVVLAAVGFFRLRGVLGRRDVRQCGGL
jgi:hypothetical protein